MNENHFVMPSALLRQLDECSAGGFVLFTLDERGCPQVHCSFDNPVAALALQAHMLYWASAFQRLNHEHAYKALTQKPEN